MTTYYTPRHWGKTLLEGVEQTSPRGIIDPAVGDGSLLLCSAKRFPESALFGVDVDPAAVTKSKAALPNAVVSHANALELSSLARSTVWRRRNEIDTVVTNPPFAGERKCYRVNAVGETIICSIAGAHLLSSIEFYTPDTVAAIMPRSFFHSDRDHDALKALCQRYDIVRAGDLHRTAFARGSASSEIVYFRRRQAVAAPGTTTPESNAAEGLKSVKMQVHLVRGGIPVHIAAKSGSASGFPFVHTKGLADASGFQLLVSPGHRGIIAGVAILVPRVGMPRLKHLRVREFLSPIQLSDCVIALCFPSREHASAVCTAMQRDFRGLLRCWAGTGAPYTTVSKMRDHLQRLGLDCRVSSRWPIPALAVANGHSAMGDAEQGEPTSSH